MKKISIVIAVVITIAVTIFLFHTKTQEITDNEQETLHKKAETAISKKPISEKNISEKISSKASSTIITAIESTKTESYQQWKDNYQTEAYYLYDQLYLCKSFQDYNITDETAFDNHLEKISYKTNDQAFLNRQLKLKKICLTFFKNYPKANWNQREVLLKKAVAQGDTNAIYQNNFNQVFMQGKNIRDIMDSLTDGLVAKDPQSYYLLGALTDAFSSKENRRNGISASLVFHACELGMQGCDADSFMVKETCKRTSACGGNMQETIRLATPAEYSNALENAINQIGNIHSKQEWHAFIRENFSDEEINNSQEYRRSNAKRKPNSNSN